MSTAHNERAQRKADKAYAKASRPWHQKKRFWILGVVAVLVLWAAIGGSGGGQDAPAGTTGGQATQQPADTPDAPTPAQTPITVTADKLVNDLKGNALKASDTYKDKRVTVTGYVSNIDASGAYINLRGNDEFTLTGIRINTSDEQRAAVADLSEGEKVTVTGTVVDVGEVMGYSIDAEAIK